MPCRKVTSRPSGVLATPPSLHPHARRQRQSVGGKPLERCPEGGQQGSDSRPVERASTVDDPPSAVRWPAAGSTAASEQRVVSADGCLVVDLDAELPVQPAQGPQPSSALCPLTAAQGVRARQMGANLGSRFGSAERKDSAAGANPSRPFAVFKRRFPRPTHNPALIALCPFSLSALRHDELLLQRRAHANAC